ncbi:MAG: deoxyuridine 5'-triphosphate nucleotidohydrolase [Clostridia bacterium]|nr:deoxyuridine 5'-triphosphate nucleotidohydrolase [Clostridia bacterium]
MSEALSEAIVQVVYHSDAIERLRYIDGKSDWVDLRSAEEVQLKAGELRYISLGVSVRLPEGYELWIAPRSSTFKTYGILMPNSPGIVDESYSSDEDILRMPALALRDTVIHVNDRICQCRLMAHQPALRFEQVESLGHQERGGFGSTGRQ